MSIIDLDAQPLTKPMAGLEIKRWFANVQALKETLRAFLSKRALVCLSPNRSERCDTPATGIFWQDDLEWYPCCDKHFPSQSQGCGSTRMRGGAMITLSL